MGYSREQIQELEETIKRIDCDTVIAGTPVDLRRVIKVNKPIVRVHYELDEIGHPSLEELITRGLGLGCMVGPGEKRTAFFGKP